MTTTHILLKAVVSLALTAVVHSRADAAAAESRSPRSDREIWAATWKPIPADCDMLTQMIFLEGQFVPGAANTMPDPVPVARQSRDLPAGRVAIHWWRYSNSLFLSPADRAVSGGVTSTVPSPWTLDALKATKSEWMEWLDRYFAAGGRLDYLIGDCERWGTLANWDLPPGAPAIIAQDPRAARPWRGTPPLRVLLEGVDPTRVMDFTSTNDYLGWNRAIGTMTAATMNDAIFAPARALYPNVRGSNFAGVRMTDRPPADLNGHPQAHDNIVGTAAAPAQYGAVKHAATAWFIDVNDPTKLSKSGHERVTRSAWFSFMTDVQHARACRRSAPEIPLNPWVAFSHWTGDANEVHYPSDQRYWDEMIRHCALSGATMFNFWNPTHLSGATEGSVVAVTNRDEGARRLNRVLQEINQRTLGAVTRQAEVQPLSYRASVVTTGAQRTDGLWVWRTTVKPGVTLLRNRRDGTLVPLDAQGAGRWDTTTTSTGPDYEVATTSSMGNQKQISSKPTPGSRRTPSDATAVKPSRVVNR